MNTAKTVICLHKDHIEATKGGDIGTCTLCGQKSLYQDRKPQTVITRGYINGVMTDVHPVISQVAESIQEAKPVPPKPRKRKKQPAYWEENKEDVLADYKSMTLRDFFKRWHLSTGYWNKLKKKWAVVPNRTKRTTRIQAVPSLRAAIPLPPFPPFNENWNFSTKEEWLRTYRDLRLGVK